MRLDPRVALTDRRAAHLRRRPEPALQHDPHRRRSASDTFGLEANNMPTQRQPVSMDAIEAIDISLSNYDVTMPAPPARVSTR